MKLNNVDVVIFCGGFGKRLRPRVGNLQKVMAEVNGRPFLDFLIENLKQQGIERIILCTGHNADMVEDYYRKNNSGLIFEFSSEDEPLGTGGALKNAGLLVKSSSFFCLNGDSFCNVSFSELLNFHNERQATSSLVVVKAKENSDFGGIVLDETGRIACFKEKEPSSQCMYVNAGVYCFNKKIFSLMPDKKQFSLEYDFFPSLIGNKFYGFVTKQDFFDIGTPESYEKARKVLGK